MATFQASARGNRFLNMQRTLQTFTSQVAALEQEAAQVATETSRRAFTSELNLRGRPYAPPRRGRNTTLGSFGNSIVWERLKGGTSGTGNTGAGIDIQRLPWYWIIQEIGTNAEAEQLSNPTRTWKVESQVGRRISPALAWASGPGAGPKPGVIGASGDQLFYVSELNTAKAAAGYRVRSARTKGGGGYRIRREIKGKHFLRAGGLAGYANLASNLTDAVRRTFN